jgi:hypothetical protein
VEHAPRFADAARPERLLSDKLRVMPVGRDPALRRVVIAWAERRRDACRDRLAGLGATGSPRSWRAALAKLAEESPRRTLAAPRRILKLAKFTLRLKVAEAILALTKCPRGGRGRRRSGLPACRQCSARRWRPARRW